MKNSKLISHLVSRFSFVLKHYPVDDTILRRFELLVFLRREKVDSVGLTWEFTRSKPRRKYVGQC